MLIRRLNRSINKWFGENTDILINDDELNNQLMITEQWLN